MRPARDHFTAVAKQENLSVGKPLEYDAFHPIHQVPGGMISNFRFQLANLGKLDKLHAVLEEVAQVRSEFGYPIMVTPYSQFFGVQAAINVIVGERYKEITDEVILYALGFWGEEEAASVEANLKDRILSRPRAKELSRMKPPELSLDEFHAKFGGAGVSDDDALLNYFAGGEYVAAMKAAGPVREYVSGVAPLMGLIERLAAQKDRQSLDFQRPGLKLRLRRL
jgi:oxaloacetate decarboxylase alpha subunit